MVSCCRAIAHHSSQVLFPKSASTMSCTSSTVTQALCRAQAWLLCCNEVERALLQAAQRQGTVSQEVARQTDGVLLAVGALSSVLKKKVSQQVQLLLLLPCVSAGHYCNSPGSGPLMVTRNQMLLHYIIQLHMQCMLSGQLCLCRRLTRTNWKACY